MDLFELATRKNFKFDTAIGQLNVIDLWDLPLTHTRNANLNDVAKNINSELKSELKAEVEKSFVGTTRNSKKALLEQKLEVVKYIIAIKIQDLTDQESLVEKKKLKAKLTDLLAARKENALASLTEEEILAQLAALN